jgi:H+-transporting ATPase
MAESGTELPAKVDTLLAPDKDRASSDDNDGVDESLMMTGPDGLTDAEVTGRLERFGRNELVSKITPKWKIFVSKFRGPMPYMIWIAIIIEAIILDWLNFGVLLLLQMVNGCLAFNEATKAGDAIAALKASLKPEAQVKRNGIWQNVDAGTLVPGDLVVLAAGFAVPADCRMCEGQPIDVDQAALTGESLPVTFESGGIPKMGSMVTRGECEALVLATGANTFFGKTASLINSVKSVPHFQMVLLTIMKAMVGASLCITLIVFSYLLAQGEGVLETLAFCVVLVISSIPIALPVVSTTTMSVGCKTLADKKAIVAELHCVEQLAGMNMLCSDKTGTLTLNKMVLQSSTSYMGDMTKAQILQYAALAAKWKEPPKDALDTLVLEAVDKAPLDAYEQLSYTPFDPVKKRTESTLKGPDMRTFVVTKGAPHIILALSENRDVMGKAFEEEVEALAERGIRALAVAVQYEGEPMNCVGLLTFLDPPRPDTKETIRRAGLYGCSVKMITGDHLAIAKETARQLGMGTNILNAESLPAVDTSKPMPKTLGDDYGEMIEGVSGFAQVFPEHKFLIVESLRQRGWVVGMTGDGVNDAPALKRADIGIAVQGATDTAAAAADIVLTAPGLSVMIDAIVIAREIFQRIKNYLVYRVAVTYQLLMFFFLALFAFQPKEFGYNDDDVDGSAKLPDFFSLPVLSLVIIVILNDFAIISIAYDNVIASAIPETWTLKVVFTVACWLGTVAVCGQMTLLSILLNHHNGDGFFAKFSYGQTMTSVWLTLSLLDFFSVLSARIPAGFFWQRMIGIPLLCAAIFAMAVSTLLAATWPFNGASHGVKMEALTGAQLGFIWAYCIGWFLVQDFSKRAIYEILLHFDFEGIRTAEELRIQRAKELLGESIESKVDSAENAIKLLAAKVEPIESLLYEVKLLQAEVAQLKAEKK